MSYAVALTLTLVIEIPIVLGLLRFWLGVPPRHGLPLAIVGNLLTHPIVWFVTPIVPVQLADPDIVVTVAEVFAMIVEALVFRSRIAKPFPRLLIVSFVANAASLMIGSAIV